MAVSKRARAVWKRLGQSYGTRMADTYGTEPPSDWCRVIDRTDPERLELALVKIRQTCIQHPPTLGQFEAVIPARQTFRESIPDKLACHAMATLNLCRHQIMTPWNYFGSLQDDGGRSPLPVTSGVVIPGCKHEECRAYGKSHRVLARDLS